MTGLLIAIQFLTRLPTPAVQVSGDAFARSMRWFPAVGLIVGAFVAGAGWCGAWVDPRLGALAALGAWIAVTGALHLDGLGDVADACGAAHKDRARLLAVLADPHIGSFGAVAIGFQLLVKFLLLQMLVEQQAWAVLALIPFAARIGPLVWARWLPELHSGLGSRFRGVIRPADLAIWTLLLIAACWAAPALLATPLLLIVWAVWLRSRLGGISGDGHGAGIEWVESGLLLAAFGAGKLA